MSGIVGAIENSVVWPFEANESGQRQDRNAEQSDCPYIGARLTPDQEI